MVPKGNLLTTLTLLGSLQHLLQLLLGFQLRTYCLILHSASVLSVKVVKALLLWSTRQWFLTLMFRMALPLKHLTHRLAPLLQIAVRLLLRLDLTLPSR